MSLLDISLVNENTADISSFQEDKSMQAPLIGNLNFEVNTPSHPAFTKALSSCAMPSRYKTDKVSEICQQPLLKTSWSFKIVPYKCRRTKRAKRDKYDKQ